MRAIITFLLIFTLPVFADSFISAPQNPATHSSYVDVETDGDIALPSTALTYISTVNIWVYEISFNNNSAAALTVSVTHGDGTPFLASTISIAANTSYICRYEGKKAKGGLRWVASGSGITGYVRGFRKP